MFGAADWWLDEVIGGFIRSPVLDTFYWDDPSFGNEHEVILTNFSSPEIAVIGAAMSATRKKAEKMIADMKALKIQLEDDKKVLNVSLSSKKTNFKISP